jgi:hypothetical protein
VTITSRTYVAANLFVSGSDIDLYTVPSGVTSRIQLFTFAGYGGEGTYYDVSMRVVAPDSTIVGLAYAPYLPPRVQLEWTGILNLEAGYGLHLYIGTTEGTASYGVLITGEDFTSPP